MKTYTTIKNIQFNKRSVELTLTNGISKEVESKTSAVDLIVKAVMVGASGNCINQITDFKLDASDFEAISEARKKVEEIFDELSWKLQHKTNEMRVANHKFH